MSGENSRAPFRFCVATGGVKNADEWSELARKAEDLGYDLLAVTDHVQQEMAPFTALAAAAAVTTTLRVGTYVMCHDLRSPVVLAKEFATLDILSGGRAEVGLGAGWLMSDYTRTGTPFGSRALRFERFAEYVELVRELLAGGTVSHDGPYFSVSDVRCVPAPVQPIPLLIGGSRRRLIEFAAQRADTVSIAPTTRADGRRSSYWDAEIDDRVRWARTAAAGRSAVPEIDVAIHECRVLPRPRAVLTALSAARGVREDQIDAIPSLLIGTPEHVAELLLARRERWGASRITIPESAVDEMAPIVARLAGR
ncbi:TIGR03621 family F420-dependent LLM class oxidoreductase [Kitasatospora sp. LaBMicrA B282]|uniref:TIGR03621 family F420-dependent LLM class oxidoreductase n=1 Tax=Kitasatospora sp. LaBMicrA B282 TaxID=3420949 RepID=UPI003D0C859A